MKRNEAPKYNWLTVRPTLSYGDGDTISLPECDRFVQLIQMFKTVYGVLNNRKSSDQQGNLALLPQWTRQSLPPNLNIHNKTHLTTQLINQLHVFG